MWANISDRNSHCGDQTCLFRHDHSCSQVTLVSHGLLPLHSLVTSHYDTSNMQYPAFERCTLKQSTSKSQSQKKVSCSTCIMEDHKMPAPTKMEEFCSCWHCCCCNSFFHIVPGCYAYGCNFISSYGWKLPERETSCLHRVWVLWVCALYACCVI